MTPTNRAKTWLRQLVALVRPSVLQARRCNKVVDDEPDGIGFDGQRDYWASRLSIRHPDRRTAAQLMYSSEMDRLASMESKAVGLLQACAISAAGAVLALTGPLPSQVLAFAAVAYLVCAGAACCWPLLPRPRHRLVPSALESPTDGNAEMVAAVSMSVPYGIRLANYLDAAVRDLGRAAALTVIALVSLALA